jgi:tRNA(Arg) A34 adenosine deaminase TadA/GNAT superfamily N-acetyltransferase
MKYEGLVRQVNQLANESAKQGNDPFAALLVKDGKVVASSMDLSVQKSDPTAHAELNLIRQFCQENNLITLEGYTLVSSTEPCVMCSGAIHWSRISKVIYSVSQQRLKTASNGKDKPTCDEIVNVGNKKIDVIGPILEDEGYKVFLDFPMIPKVISHHALLEKTPLDIIKIRVAKDDDLNIILEMQNAWMNNDPTYGYTPDSIMDLNKKLGEYFLVGIADDKIIGFIIGKVHQKSEYCVFDENTPYLEIEDLYIKPEMRNQDFGGILLDKLIDIAKENKVNNYYIYSSVKDQESVQRFYRKHGFQDWSMTMFRKD